MRKFNSEEFIEFIVFLGFATLIFYLLNTGKIYNFISPKMKGNMIFSFFIFTILALYKGNKIFIPQKNRFTSGSYLILIITIIIGFFAAENGLSVSASANRSLNLSAYNESEKIKLPNNSGNYKNLDSILDIEIGKDSDSIIIEEKNFYKAVNELGVNIEKYKGKRVKISGFVFKKEDFKKDEFVVARMLMACCAADAQVIGLMSKFETETKLEKDSWVEVEGIIEATDYTDSTINGSIKLPIIKVEKVKKIKKPDNIYVYP